MIGRARSRLDACTVALAALLAAAPARAVPGIDLIQVRPNPFTPNDDGVRDSTELFFTPLGDSASVLARVRVFRVAGEVLLGEILPPTNVPVDVEQRVPWSPGPIADGLYRFDIEVTEASVTSTGSAYVEADTTAPSITIGALAPNPFDPGPGGSSAHLHVPITVVTSDSSTTTAVLVRRNAVVQDSLGIVADGGTFQLEWDGRTGNGTDAPSNVYEIFADSRDIAGNVSTASRGFTVDRDDPVITVVDAIQTTSFPVTIRGTARDDDRVESVAWRVLPDSTFVPADSSSAPADSASFVVILQDNVPVPGVREVEIRARDEVGHDAIATVAVAYDTFLPEPGSITPVDGPGPYGEGDLVRIRTIWNADDLDIEGNFSELDARWVSGLESVVAEGGGSYLVSYMLSRSTDKSSGTKDVRITARRGFLAGRDTVSVIFAGSTTDTEISIDRNRFDPALGEVATIQAPEMADPIQVEIYNLGGAHVRSLSGTGQIEWDGRTEEGALAASGTYFLRCTSRSIEQVRRLVVKRSG